MSTPTRILSAAFCAVGAVLCDFTNHNEHLSDDEYFKVISSLPLGSSVKLRGKNRKGRDCLYDGILLAVEEVRGELMLKIQTEKASMADSAASGLTAFVPKSRVRDVTPGSGDEITTLANLPANQRGVRLAPSSSFASSVIGSTSIYKFEGESKMVCLIVGQASTISAELQDEKFCSGPDWNVDGTLAELLRVRRLFPVGSPYRTNIFATNSRRPPRYDGDMQPALVIFDGALGFLKWRDNFPSSHWLVLLDETRPNFDAGRQTLNNLYLQRSGADPSIDGLPSLPAGMEMVLFQEKMK